MNRSEKLCQAAMAVPVLMLLTIQSNGQGNQPVIQADVYNALYEAHVECDENLDKSRSEFITDMFERNRENSVSMEILGKLLSHRVKVAKQSISDKQQERELYVAQVLQGREEPAPGHGSPEESAELREKIKTIDNFIKGKWQYVEVNECILGLL